MKQFLAFVRKEFYHISRDKRTILILLGMPIVQIIIFGFAITTEVKNVRVAVFDPSKDEVTQKIIDKIDANEYMNVIARIDNPQDIQTTFKEGKADIILVFGDHFGENFRHTRDASVQLITDGTDPNTASTLTGYVSNVISSAQQELSGQYKAPLTITPKVKLLYNPGMKGAYNFVPGVMGLILMLICAMMTSISIVREKETGTMEVLLVSPVKPIYIILAKAIPYMVLSCINIITILLLSVYVLDVPIAGSLVLLFGVSLLFILVSLALGLLISTIAETQVAAMLVSGMVLMMPVMILSGMIYPTENMPVMLQMISNIIPAKWYIIAVKKIMIEGLDVSFVLKEIGILSFMAFVLLIVSLKKFNDRLE
jgi:ABC-2 type transport system permease protein|nr:ABC transporter permease [uncultured Bacteroides sp.]